MTNREYLVSTLSGFGLSGNDIELIAIKSGLDLEQGVSVRDCDLAIYKRMSIVLKNTLQNVSEGGYSISWNMEALKIYYQSLCEEIGMPNTLYSQPKIRNKSNIW